MVTDPNVPAIGPVTDARHQPVDAPKIEHRGQLGFAEAGGQLGFAEALDVNQKPSAVPAQSSSKDV